MQVLLYLIAALQLLQLGGFVFLFIGNRRMKTIEMHTRETLLRTGELVAAKEDPRRMGEMLIEANRYRAEHPELWKWQPAEGDQAQPPKGE